MFIIVSGEVKVCSHQDGVEMEIARRKAGDYVGEMSIIGREPRMASLVAVGDVRTLCIDQQSFEGLIRERPDVSLAVMKVLGQRLTRRNLVLRSTMTKLRRVLGLRLTSRNLVLRSTTTRLCEVLEQ